MPSIEHPIPPVWNEHSRVLILGTMPSPKSRESGFFYMHPQNRFWNVMAQVFGKKFKYKNNGLPSGSENTATKSSGINPDIPAGNRVKPTLQCSPCQSVPLYPRLKCLPSTLSFTHRNKIKRCYSIKEVIITQSVEMPLIPASSGRSL